MNNVAAMLRTQGDLAGARLLQEQVLAAQRRLLGDQHPLTNISAWNLTATLMEAHQLEDATNVVTEHLRWLFDKPNEKLSVEQRNIKASSSALMGDRSV